MSDREPAGPRGPGHPAWVCRGEPQDRDQPRTVEQSVVFAPLVQILDAPVAQTVEQLPNLTQFFVTISPDPEHVFEVPKILPEDVLCARPCAFRSWRNSWWKYPVLIFKVFHLDRVQQRRLPL